MTAVITADAKQLVEAYKHGDAAAFDEIVRCYYEGLFTHALRRLGDAHAAEDAVQETLLRAHRALLRFNGQYHLRAWLHRILSNVCHDEGARRQRELRLVERVAHVDFDDAVQPPDDELIDRLAIPGREIVAALAALPEPYRRALVLRYVDDLSFREVAEVTGVTEGNARARVHRARAALKRTLGASVAVFLWLIPVLRRAERTAVADPGGASLQASMQATVTATQASPVLARVAESGLVERAASLAGSLGIAASLAVPVGVSQVADRVSPPPAPVTQQVETVAAPPLASGAGTVVDTSKPAVTVVPAPPRERAGAPSTTAAPGLLGTGGLAKPALVGVPGAALGANGGGSPDRAGTADPASPSTSPTTAAPAAPPTIKSFVLESSDLTATSGWRTDLAGTIRVKLGTSTLRGNVTGVLAAEPKQEPAPSNAAEEDGSTSTTAAPAPAEPRPFTSELTVRLDDGRVVKLRLTGTLTDKDDGSAAATGELRALDEVCGVELGSAKLSGTFLLRDAPLTSKMTLAVDGFALDDAKATKGDCAA